MTESEKTLPRPVRADGLRDGWGASERALLVGVELHEDVWALQDSLDELAQLATTAGVVVVGQVTQKLDDPNPATLVGKGKLEEIRAQVQEQHADTVLFDTELSPRQL